MKASYALVLVMVLAGVACAAAPDISKAPPHPRLWIGGLPTAAGYIDPATLAERAKARAEDFTLLSESSVINARALQAVIADDAGKIAEVTAALKAANPQRGGDLAEVALAFDWIAPKLSETDRKEIAKHIGDLAAAMAPTVGRRHNAFDNNPLRRDLGVGVAALAIAGDDPRAQELLDHAQSLFDDFIELTGDGVTFEGAGDPMSPGSPMYGRGMYGGGWPEGHDYDRHGSRYAVMYFLALRSATGMDVFTGSPYWKAKPLFHIYSVLPAGKYLVPFQDDDNPFLIRHDREVMLVLAREFKDQHARWYLNHVNTERDSTSGALEFLYNEPDQPEHDYSDLPKAHYIPGNGMVYARSGWGDNDTMVAFCASDWYVYHQNNAQNVFAIYRNAPLAVKDGVYDGSVHQHYVNYSIRTIAYNGMTVYDPAEKFTGPDGPVRDAANDGGQMIQQWKGNPDTLAQWREQARRTDRPMRDVVDFKGFETNDRYTYMAAEAGRAYRPGKVPFFSRQALFVYPNWVVVFDRVEAGEASFEKTFHMHFPEQLDVTGSSAVAMTSKTNGTTIPGRLFITSLLPKDARVEKVEGNATYRGMSFPSPDGAYNGQIECPVHLNITAPEEKVSYFLTAMYACDADVESAPRAELVEETPDKVTMSLEGKYTVTFNKTGEVGYTMQQP